MHEAALAIARAAKNVQEALLFCLIACILTKTFYNRFLSGWLPIATLLKLNSKYMDLNNFLKYITPFSTQPVPLATLALFLTNTSPLIWSFLCLHFLNLCFVNLSVSVHISISKQPAPLLPPLSILSLTCCNSVILLIATFQTQLIQLRRFNKNLAIANRSRQLSTQYVEGIHKPKYYTVTLKSRLRVTQGHWKRNHWTDHTRLTISQVI